MRILIMNGPNLNLLGRREPGIYGADTFESILSEIRASYPEIEFVYYQSNHEGALVDALHEAGFGEAYGLIGGSVDGVVLNAGAYTHTSVALHDAIAAIPIPVIEVHISNVHQREEFRHHSYLSSVAAGIVIGFGLEGYRLAVEGLSKQIVNQHNR